MLRSQSAFLLLPLFVILFVSSLATAFAPFGPDQISDSEGFFPLQSAPSAKHLLGTNQLGMDVFSRLVYGAQSAVLVGVAVLALALLLGVGFGVLAGLSKGPTDTTLRYVFDIVLAFPGFLMAIGLSFGLSGGRPSYWSTTSAVIIAEALSFSARHFYLIRASVRAKLENQFVLAAHAMGATKTYLAYKHLLPGVVQQNMPVVVQSASSGVATLAGLGFLGLGLGYGSGAEWGFDLAQSVGPLLSGNPLPFAIFSSALISFFVWLAFAAEKAGAPKFKRERGVNG